MKNTFKCFLLFILSHPLLGQDFNNITIDQDISKVQPMTGIVFWPHNGSIDTDAISLEFSYMLYNDIVEEEGVYDWSPVETLLDEIASRNHQAVLRFRFSYPGRTTSVPDYIKALSDYNETEGISEGNTTWFPDWTNQELKDFTLEFYEKYAERYDNDPRLAFVQTGFGLWAEYHIYDGPRIIGTTFPSKEFQTTFLEHLDAVFEETDWSISIDAADDTYSPFSADQDLLDVRFGLFDDSFMHSSHSGHNESNWNFFDRERYKRTSAGGEFSYYSTYDQQNVLNEHEGAYGIAFETFVENFHMSYINGNDQNKYHTLTRIREASMYMGYRFKINSFQSKDGASIVEIENVGVAPFYYDAYVTVNGVRSSQSLKLLAPGEVLTCDVEAGGTSPVLTIESDRILDTQEIGYYGTENTPYVYVPQDITEPVLDVKKTDFEDYELTVWMQGQELNLKTSEGSKLSRIELYHISGTKTMAHLSHQGIEEFSIDMAGKNAGIYILKTNLETRKIYFE